MDLIDFLEFLKKGDRRATLRSPTGFCWHEREGTRIGPAVPQSVEKVPFRQKWDGKNRKGTKRGRIPWPSPGNDLGLEVGEVWSESVWGLPLSFGKKFFQE